MGEVIANWRQIAHLPGVQGDKARAGLARVPDLSPYEFMFWRAFHDLMTQRPMSGMGGVGPIPLREIDWYADRADMDPTERLIFERVIRAMDTAYLEAYAKRQQAASAK